MRLGFKFFELLLGRNPYRLIIKFHPNSSWYNNDYKQFLKALGGAKCDFTVRKSMPCLYDKSENAGTVNSIYFIQDLYVAQKIFKNNPQKHVDVGSRIDGFVAHIASFREIELLDVRKMESTIPNVIFKQADFMDENKVPTDYCDSISSLHALEHFGLGRYGDPIDPEGHLKGFKNITKMLKSGGKFYFSVPMGRQRIDFNAHRVFGMPYLIKMVSDNYDIISFSYIEDGGIFHKDVDLTKVFEEKINTSFGCKYGCALFELSKK